MRLRSYKQNDITFIEVSNNSHLKVVLIDLGASVFHIYYDEDQLTRNVKDTKDLKRLDCYYGKTIGRTSNRLKGYRFEIHDEIYNLEPNEDSNVLHGGVNGLSFKKFNVTTNTYLDRVEVIFSYLSKHLEGGYPGNIDIKVTYVIYSESNRLEVRYSASSDMDTLFSLTNHTYFSLGNKDISNLELFIRGHHYLNIDKDTLLPISKEPVSSVFDFSKYKLISKDIDNDHLKGKKQNGYDNFFYFDEVNPKLINASLRNKKYRVDIFTDFEGVQIYTSNFEPEFDLDNELKYRDAVALEPSDSFLNYPILLKNNKYSRNITYFFLKNN